MVDRKEALQQEIDKLLEAGFIREVQYPEWLANPAMVRKHNVKWRMCVDFTDLNKACLKDLFPFLESTSWLTQLPVMTCYAS